MRLEASSARSRESQSSSPLASPTTVNGFLDAGKAREGFTIKSRITVRVALFRSNFSDACYDRGGAPLFFLAFLNFGSLRPFPRTVLEKKKNATMPDENFPMA